MLITARDEGGAEIVAEQLVSALGDRCAFTVVVPSTGGMRDQAARLSTVARVVPLPLQNAGGALIALPEIRRLSRDADVVHLNSNHPASRLAAAIALALDRRVPFVSVEHSGTPVAAVSVPRGFASSAAGLFRFSRRHAAVIVAVSAENARRLSGEYGIDPSRITVVHNGIDLEPFRLAPARRLTRRRMAGVHENERMIVVPARQAPNKGHRFLVAAARTVVDQVPGTRFVLAGPGEPDPRVDRAIRDAGLAASFTDLGFLPHAEMIEVVCGADLLVLPSLAEGLSLTLIEGMAAGAIVVSSAVGGAPELMTDGREGFLVPPGDVEALGGAIVRGLRLGAPERDEMAARARERAGAFSIAATAGKMMAVYERALAARG
jgi:glycosyltransferase involved in cell wall biosynthesis